jgi:hypothetical protein
METCGIEHGCNSETGLYMGSIWPMSKFQVISRQLLSWFTLDLGASILTSKAEKTFWGLWVPGFRKSSGTSDLTGAGDFGTGDFTEVSHQNSIPAQIIKAYGGWIKGFLDDGWVGYFFTFMFRPIPGSMDAKIEQMHKEIDWVYGGLAKKSVKKPRSSGAQREFLPKGVFFPDTAGSGSSKSKLRDVLVNDGAHFHGIVVAHPGSLLTEPLDEHFHHHQKEYRSETLHRVHVERITHKPKYTADYGGKSIKRGRFPEEHILVLPKALSELPSKGHKFCRRPEHAIKAIQSSLNVSEQVAGEIYDAARAGAGKG